MATWASNTVGMGIRKTMLPHWINEVVGGWPSWVRAALKLDADLLDDVFDRLLNVTSLGLSGGNEIVFDEIGSSFTSFGVAFSNLTAPSATRITNFLNTFSPSQPLLKEAMGLYYR